MEVALRMLTPYPIHGTNANRIQHEALGYVLDPVFRDADGAGFRNPEDVGHAELVALGDSHTYGFNVRREDNWPSQLAAAAGLSVYNYGMGGYGVLQHFWLLDHALERKPRNVIVGLYLPNDLADTCRMAATEFWRLELARRGLHGIECDLAAREEEEEAEASFWQRTALGSLLEDRVGRRLARMRRPGRFVWLDDAGRATPLPKRHLSRHAESTDRGRPGVAAAYDLVGELLVRMAEMSRLHGARFGVLFIPSKESVLFEAMDSADPFRGKLLAIVEQERALTSDLDRFLRSRGVSTALALGALQQNDAEPRYPESASGHPIRSGYLRYAEAARGLVEPPASSGPR